MWDEWGPLARRDHRVININIDPSALGHPVMHEVAMQADAAQALNDLLDATVNQTNSIGSDWLSQLRAVRQKYEQGLLDSPTAVDGVMHPAALAIAIGKAIGTTIPSDTLAVFDGGHTTFWSNDLTPVHNVRTRFHEPGMSHLGFGLPYALALQLLHTNKVVFNITGDGSFGFSLQELDTARRNRLNVITIIHNNATWGIIRAGQKKQLNFELGTSLEGSDYAAIARGFRCHGETVNQVNEFEPALKRSLASGLPAVLDCRTCFVPHPASPMFGSMNRYGFDALTKFQVQS